MSRLTVTDCNTFVARFQPTCAGCGHFQPPASACAVHCASALLPETELHFPQIYLGCFKRLFESVSINHALGIALTHAVLLADGEEVRLRTKWFREHPTLASLEALLLASGVEPNPGPSKRGTLPRITHGLPLLDDEDPILFDIDLTTMVGSSERRASLNTFVPVSCQVSAEIGRAARFDGFFATWKFDMVPVRIRSNLYDLRVLAPASLVMALRVVCENCNFTLPDQEGVVCYSVRRATEIALCNPFNRGVIEMLLMIAGVEPNPGPRGGRGNKSYRPVQEDKKEQNRQEGRAQRGRGGRKNKSGAKHQRVARGAQAVYNNNGRQYREKSGKPVEPLKPETVPPPEAAPQPPAYSIANPPPLKEVAKPTQSVKVVRPYLDIEELPPEAEEREDLEEFEFEDGAEPDPIRVYYRDWAQVDGKCCLSDGDYQKILWARLKFDQDDIDQEPAPLGVLRAAAEEHNFWDRPDLYDATTTPGHVYAGNVGSCIVITWNPRLDTRETLSLVASSADSTTLHKTSENCNASENQGAQQDVVIEMDGVAGAVVLSHEVSDSQVQLREASSRVPKPPAAELPQAPVPNAPIIQVVKEIKISRPAFDESGDVEVIPNSLSYQFEPVVEGNLVASETLLQPYTVKTKFSWLLVLLSLFKWLLGLVFAEVVLCFVPDSIYFYLAAASALLHLYGLVKVFVPYLWPPMRYRRIVGWRYEKVQKGPKEGRCLQDAVREPNGTIVLKYKVYTQVSVEVWRFNQWIVPRFLLDVWRAAFLFHSLSPTEVSVPARLWASLIAGVNRISVRSESEVALAIDQQIRGLRSHMNLQYEDELTGATGQLATHAMHLFRALQFQNQGNWTASPKQ